MGRKKGYMEDVIKGDTFQSNIFYSQFVSYPMCFVLSFSIELIFILYNGRNLIGPFYMSLINLAHDQMTKPQCIYKCFICYHILLCKTYGWKGANEINR